MREKPARPQHLRGPLPIVIGVTGHRDVHPLAVERLEQRVRAIFDKLLHDYPDTPLLVLSPLAPGADRLVARIAMEPRYQIPVVVPMPLEQESYELQFTPAERAEFRRLLIQVRCSYFVGYYPGNNGWKTAVSKHARDLQYAQVGAYMVRNCQILLALWDGKPPKKKIGGTAQIVTFQRTGQAPNFGPKRRPLDFPEFGPVYHVFTPRAGDEVDPNAEFECEILWPQRGAAPDAQRSPEAEKRDERVTRAMFARMDRFNADAIRLKIRAGRLETQRIQTAAERLARRFQRFTATAMNALYVGALVATVSFVLYAHLSPAFQALALNVSITIVALYLYRTAEKRKWQNRHQDYRAITEGLRVQEYWQRSDIRETVADHYLRQHRGELDWIRNAIRVCRLLDDTAVQKRRTPEERRKDLRDVREDWIDGPEGQRRYFEKRSDADKLSARRLRVIATVLLAGSLLLVFIIGVGFNTPLISAIPPPLEAGHTALEEHPVWKALIVLTAILAVVSGLAESFSDKNAYAAHSKRYARMKDTFDQASWQLGEILARYPFTKQDVGDAQDVIRDLGDESLVEQGEWMRLHREHPLEFIRSG